MRKVVFTNGCFDLIHVGHIDLLKKAKKLGSKLIVGINSDLSVSNIKGKHRPIIAQDDRKTILSNLKSVDEVRIFEELTPENLIREIKPDVLVKGGDWNEDEIVGAAFVKQNGGEVHTISLKENISSSEIIKRIRGKNQGNLRTETSKDIDKIVEVSIKEHQKIFDKIRKEQSANIEATADLIFRAISQGNKILLCGNGESAVSAQHIAVEFINRFGKRSKSLAAIALTANDHALTAMANSLELKKQVGDLAKRGDVLVGISAEGSSPIVLSSIMMARKLGCKIIGLTGARGQKMTALCDACVMISTEKVSRIQEANIIIGHIWCEIVDNKFFDINKSSAQN